MLYFMGALKKAQIDWLVAWTTVVAEIDLYYTCQQSLKSQWKYIGLKNWFDKLWIATQ